MKKSLMKLFAVFVFITVLINTSFNAYAYKELGPYDREVAIRDATDPVDPQQERSLIKTCQAFISGNQIEVYFNKPIGEVYVVIVNQMGRVVSSAYCNSEFEFSTYLLKPGSGIYFMYITSSTGYQGEGSFTIN
ncbi:MAG: DUF3244 domain-containing protein [Bacteroidales bacterium]